MFELENNDSLEIEILGSKFYLDVDDPLYMAQVIQSLKKVKEYGDDLQKEGGDKLDDIREAADYIVAPIDYMLCEEGACKKILGKKFNTFIFSLCYTYIFIESVSSIRVRYF